MECSVSECSAQCASFGQGAALCNACAFSHDLTVPVDFMDCSSDGPLPKHVLFQFNQLSLDSQYFKLFTYRHRHSDKIFWQSHHLQWCDETKISSHLSQVTRCNELIELAQYHHIHNQAVRLQEQCPLWIF